MSDIVQGLREKLLSTHIHVAMNSMVSKEYNQHLRALKDLKEFILVDLEDMNDTHAALEKTLNIIIEYLQDQIDLRKGD